MDQGRARRSARRLVGRVVPPLARADADRARLRNELAHARQRLAASQQRVDELRTGSKELRRELKDLRNQMQRRGVVDDRDLQYVFVITYGRSGSTLLQGVLNSIPGYVVRGENRGVLYHLFQLQKAILRQQRTGDRTHRDEPTSPWFGIDEYRGRVALRNMRAFLLDTLLRPPPGTRVTGFKELRWFQQDWPAYLTFVQRVFPGARFVLNTRDHDAVLQSKWWVHAADGREQLETWEQQLTEMAELLGERAYRVHYDDWVADPERLRGLFDWLGEPFDADAVRAVLAVRHSY